MAEELAKSCVKLWRTCAKHFPTDGQMRLISLQQSPNDKRVKEHFSEVVLMQIEHFKPQVAQMCCSDSEFNCIIIYIHYIFLLFLQPVMILLSE